MTNQTAHFTTKAVREVFAFTPKAADQGESFVLVEGLSEPEIAKVVLYTDRLQKRHFYVELWARDGIPPRPVNHRMTRLLKRHDAYFEYGCIPMFRSWRIIGEVYEPDGDEMVWPCLRFPCDGPPDSWEAQNNALRNRAERIFNKPEWFLTVDQYADRDWWALTFRDATRKATVMAAFGQPE